MHFHPYLPVIRQRDPDICYQRGPVLFWAIIVTACRRYAREDTVFQFLVDSLLPQVWNSISQPPLKLSVINAVLLLATWPFPNIRFLSDPSLIFAGIALNSSFLSGLHTGRGSHTEFHATLYQQDTTVCSTHLINPFPS
jgi:transcriptional regulatory protein LEU3